MLQRSKISRFSKFSLGKKQNKEKRPSESDKVLVCQRSASLPVSGVSRGSPGLVPTAVAGHPASHPVSLCSAQAQS